MRRLLFAALLALAATSASVADPSTVGEETRYKSETAHPYRTGLGGRPERVWTETLSFKDASYIAAHFSRFELAEGDYAIVRSPDGKQEWRYTGLGRGDLGLTPDGFWSSHINGDTAIVELWSGGSSSAYGFTIDRLARGFPTALSAADTNQAESLCGVDDSNWARCYEASEPVIYDKSRAVARLLINGTVLCTGWLVGTAGHLITNNHCVGSAFDATNTDYEFMAEGATCGTSCVGQLSCHGTVVPGGTLVKTDATLDYSLVLLPGNPSATYGFLRLRDVDPAVDERIYIPAHPQGQGKKISVTSTDPSDASGFCEVASLASPACVPGSPKPDIGYFCDTEGGSSGSPVIAYSDHRVVSLHHCGTCVNRGLHITDVIADLGASLPPGSIFGPAGELILDRDRYGCGQTITIEVRDADLVGLGPQSASIASPAEPGAETVVLIETPPGSGKFRGSILATALPAAGGDGKLSLADGDAITATYVDADDGAGGSSLPRTDTAVADCAAPILTNVQTANLQGTQVDVNFTSDEACDSVVTYGLAGSPPPSQSASNPTEVTAHTVHLAGLTPCETYIFRVSCIDPAGNPASNDNGGSYFTFTTGANFAPTYASSSVPVPIPDNNSTGAIATIVVPELNNLADVNVKVSITHTYDSDLVVSLTSPDNTTVILSNRRPGAGGGVNFTNTVFDDQAATAISQVTVGQSPYTGSFIPDQALGVFSGKSVAGTWTLKVADLASEDVGTITKFELSFTYPFQPCGPNADRFSHSLVADSCSGGGAGNADGVWDDAEDARISVTVRNSGSVPLTGVSAQLVPLTAGVSVPDDTASYPDLAVGTAAVSQAPHFTARLPLGLPCGTTVSFRLDITSDQGTFMDTLSLVSGLIGSSTSTALDEPFTGGIPGNWTIVNGGSGGGAAATWTTANPGNRIILSPLVQPVAIVDSDNAGSAATSDEQLITAPVDLSTATSVALEFDQYFRHYDFNGSEKGDVDVRSSLTGGAWVNVFRNENADSPNPDHRNLNISAQAAGAANVQIRFHYYDAAWEFWWQIDNVKVTFQSPAGCNQNSCMLPDELPDEVPPSSVRWSATKSSMSWSGVPTAAEYHVYRGTKPDFPKLLDGSPDSCLRASGPATTAAGLVENPSTSTLYWWLVRAWNGIGEGPAGFATAGPRTQDSTAPCP